MTGFTFKSLATEVRAGEKLKAARLEKNIHLEDVAKKLHIRSDYLQALENEEYSRLPAGLYGRQFLKEYCQYLHLDLKQILPLTPFTDTKEESNPFSQKILRSWRFLVFPKIIRNAVFILLFCVCLLYLLIYFRRLISPPNLEVIYPERNLVINEALIEVRGQSDPETEVQINNTVIMSSQDGSFVQEVKLKQGLNNLTISAKKKYGRESVIQRQILVEDKYEQSQ